MIEKASSGPIALAIDTDLVPAKIGWIDHRKVVNLRSDLESLFIKHAEANDLPVHRGRSNNVPTIPDALHFLIASAKYDYDDLRQYVRQLAEGASV